MFQLSTINKVIINRNTYIDRSKLHIGRNIIKVFTGQRRVGKSYLLLQLMNYIRETFDNTNIISINKELYEFGFIQTDIELMQYFDQQFKDDRKNFLFVDEIQEIKGFEKAIRSILSSGKADIYITGSNADMLSGELATFLSGRYIEIKINALSFDEFLLFNNLENKQIAFENYMKYGGLPGLININPAEAAIADYMKGIYSTILLKDVVKRHSIRNVSFLENLVIYLSDNIGSIVSAKRISDYLKSQHISISPNVVIDYIDHLCKAFLTNKVSRCDIGGRKIFEIGEKYYFEDWGLRNSIIGYKIQDIGKILENIVYHHLIYAGYKVMVGTLANKEIDFVAEKNAERIYVQVCYLLTGEKVIEREFGNLLAINDNYPKYVVSMDNIGNTASHKGIIHMHVTEFCLSVLNLP